MSLCNRGESPQCADAPLLRVEQLGKSFGGVAALQNVSFSVPKGVIQSIIGPNGAGKTTLLHCMSGILAPSRGTVTFRGVRIDGRPPHAIASLGISRTFQHVALFKNMSAIENVAVGCHRRSRAGFLACAFRTPSMRREEREIFEKAHACLEFVGIADEGTKRAGSLPLGKQKLLEIARALAAEPILLLLDEPAGGLNTSETEQLGELIEKIRRHGVTVVLIEHDMNLVMERSDSILVLHYGSVLALGTPQEIKSDERVVEIYLGEVE